LNKVEVLNKLFELVVNKKATDLHIKVSRPPVLRINGTLVPQNDLALFSQEDIETILKEITTEEQRLSFLKGMALDFAYAVDGLARFRVSALSQRGTLSLAFRIVPEVLPAIDNMGLPQICKNIITKPRGLVLVTGTAGSGKSTTLAAMINYLNQTESKNIITIEDPIEYLIPDNKCLIHQQELGHDTRSFSKALTSALRHDPDVIIIGEMRDTDTIMTAMTAAETGHLIVGTLHTVDAAQSIDRIIDVFPAEQQHQVRLQLSQVLSAVLSQTLLLGTNKGCRVAAFEIMLMNKEISKLIREQKTYEISGIIEMCRNEGMQTMDQALSLLVKNGQVSEEEAMRKAIYPAKLKGLLGEGKVPANKYFDL
jgi:twitching motility protein PilT